MTSPMYEPYHLYDFTLKSFFNNGIVNKYEVISHDYYVCSLMYIPRFFTSIISLVYV